MRAERVMVVCAVIATHICMMVVRTWRAVTVLTMVVDHVRTRVRRLGPAKRHGRCRVALKRHRKHHEPKQDCTEIDH
jgi:hypothetical protein